MSHSHYLIKNCSTKSGGGSCPTVWSELKPAFSDMVRHCDHCSKKVYLCETDEQIKFYSSVKFCIAVATPKVTVNVVENSPLDGMSATDEVATEPNQDVAMEKSRPVPNVWRRTPLPKPVHELQHKDIPAFLRKAQHSR
ncbi:hypothetical protein KTQ42_19445 [Noviherbaspirillum sp. L7-7A]|uniref:hypothetical protein n=1 Tax=Noviherbaspirillum sp. L7-7A TaxID=2850560 RepID=UPI001C2BBA1E|nr:hypothetical protein [Noviherbaspirillum sp. L7-7A]MBV0881465.1 hypothetical protein [Noviherbaspirillum sp. L7-7A]